MPCSAPLLDSESEFRRVVSEEEPQRRPRRVGPQRRPRRVGPQRCPRRVGLKRRPRRVGLHRRPRRVGLKRRPRRVGLKRRTRRVGLKRRPRFRVGAVVPSLHSGLVHDGFVGLLNRPAASPHRRRMWDLELNATMLNQVPHGRGLWIQVGDTRTALQGGCCRNGTAASTTCCRDGAAGTAARRAVLSPDGVASGEPPLCGEEWRRFLRGNWRN